MTFKRAKSYDEIVADRAVEPVRGGSNGAEPITFQIDVNRQFKNKVPGRLHGRLNGTFKTETLTLDGLIETVVKRGHPYTMAHTKRPPDETGADKRGVKTPKHGENFLSMQVITLDDDSKEPDVIEFWLTDPFFSKYGFAFVESHNSTPEAQKGHPTIVLDTPITDYELAKEALNALHWRYPHGDTSIDPTNTIFNTEGANVHRLGNICEWVDFEREILEPYRQAEAEKQAAIDAELKRRQAEHRGRGLPSGNACDAYLAGYVNWVFDDVAKEQSGQGVTRNSKIYWAGRAIGGCSRATWAPGRAAILADAETRIVEAAQANGYIPEWGDENETLRVFRRGVAKGGDPPDPPRAHTTTSSSDQSQGQPTAPPEPEPPPTPDNGRDQTHMLLGLPADDEGNAQCVKRLRGGEFLYTEAYGWLDWKGTHWGRKHAEPRLERAITETLVTRRLAAVQNQREAIVKIAKPSAHRVRATKFMFRSLALAEVGDFDAHPDLLNCQNGVVNLRTGELTSHHQSQRFTYVLPIPYHPDAEAKEWLAYLGDALNHDADIITYLQQALGYSLTGWTQEEILFYLYGPTRSGKGTFTETILAMLGSPLAAEVNFETFTARRDGDTQNFDLAPLKPCRFVAASESSKYAPLNAAKIKQLTGGNEIYCAFKHKTHFGYRPQFKIWLSSNHDVNADVDDDAAWYRLRVIRFPNCYAGREDKGLKRRLRTPESLAGILAWAVEGAKAWYRLGNKGLVTPEQVTTDTKGARSKLDFVQQWLDECTTEDGDGFVTNASLYTSYEDWCQDNGVTPKKRRSLGMALGNRGLTSEQKWVAGKNRRGYGGIKLT